MYRGHVSLLSEVGHDPRARACVAGITYGPILAGQTWFQPGSGQFETAATRRAWSAFTRARSGRISPAPSQPPATSVMPSDGKPPFRRLESANASAASRDGYR